MSYLYSSTYPVTFSGGITFLSLAYYYTTSFTYTAGQPYTVTAVIGGNPYSAYTTAVSLPVFSSNGSQLTCTWSGVGNLNTIGCGENTTPFTQKIFGPNITSPYNIPNGSLPGAVGNNTDLATILSLNNSAFTGTSNGSYLAVTSQAITTY